MSRYLLDTNVISESALARSSHPAVVSWIQSHSPSVFLSAITVEEIQQAIAKASREGATRKAAALTLWFETLLHLYSDRIFPLDVPTARFAGTLADQARAAGHAPGFADIIIAATARTHSLTILSRNLRHFLPLGVPVLDPFATLPPATSPSAQTDKD